MKESNKIIIETTTFGCTPQKAHETDAAYDTYTSQIAYVKPYSRTYIPLGFKVQLPKDIKMYVLPRSGQSGKGMIAKARAPFWLFDIMVNVRINADVVIGLVDFGYGGEVKAIVRTGKFRLKHRIMRFLGFKFFIPMFSRIAQCSFSYLPDTYIVQGNVIGERDGTGSTDIA